MNEKLKRYFDLFELTPNNSFDELKSAYKDMVKVWHPDRFSHDPKLMKKADKKLQDINEAFKELTLYYDNKIKEPFPKPPSSRPQSASSKSSSQVPPKEPSPDTNKQDPK
ncbi:heat shock protein DnaJ domain-containing protein, partial [Candidatus Magnetoovum chiemensis]